MRDPEARAYGFKLDAGRHQALRTQPPAAALRWVESELSARVVDVRPLPGGTGSAVHALSMEAPSGQQTQVVLRRYVLDWVIDEPWTPANEAYVLRLLADAERLPAPRLLAADPDGSATGTPSVVMSRLPGDLIWYPDDEDTWLRRLAEVLPVIHGVPVAPDLNDWFPYKPEPHLVPPPWTKHRRAWQQALDTYAGAPAPSDRVFIHRDFHPGNVLWTAGRISGVVDWTSSCAGPSEEDVSHCRVNIAQHHGQAQADRFLRYWQDITGCHEYHPYWDLTTVVTMVSKEPDTALDEFVAAAAARLR